MLAEKLEVSERTIYRDISDLMVSGVPVEGEAGVGYVLRRGFDLPPLMFTEQELAALTLGAQIVKSWADPALASAADNILSKVEVVLPDALKEKLNNSTLFSPMVRLSPEVAHTLALLREATESRHKICFDYTRIDNAQSSRTVWPLGLFFWGSVWTLGAWCELRKSFRNFRVDRINGLVVNGEQFEHTQGRTLSDFIADCRTRAEEDYEYEN